MDKENTLFIDLKDGRVVIELRPDLAPKHVAQIKKLAREGIYDGVVFHRVIDGFMAQTGDPNGTGMGGSGEQPAGRVHKEPHVRGVASMARSQRSQQRAQPVLHLLRGLRASSTASTPCGARSRRAWRTSTRSRAASRPRTPTR